MSLVLDLGTTKLPLLYISSIAFQVSLRNSACALDSLPNQQITEQSRIAVLLPHLSFGWPMDQVEIKVV